MIQVRQPPSLAALSARGRRRRAGAGQHIKAYDIAAPEVVLCYVAGKPRRVGL